MEQDPKPDDSNESPKWRVSGGEFNPDNTGVDPAKIEDIRSMLRTAASDDAFKKNLTYFTIEYAAQLVQPSFFIDPDLTKTVENEIAQATSRYWTYDADDLDEIKAICDKDTSELPILRAVQIIILKLNRGVDSDEESEEKLLISRSRRRLVEGVVRALYLEKEQPEINFPDPPLYAD